jgi:solute carrier family 50 (sugar transporter)
MQTPSPDADTFEEFVMKFLAPAMGVVTSELLAIGPLLTILHCRKMKHLGDLNPLPFPLLFGNSVGMIIYSVVIQNPFVFAGNIGAVLLSLFYVLTVYDLTECKGVRRRLDVILCTLSSMWLIAGFIAMLSDDHLARVRTIGIIGNIVVFFLFASPLTSCAEVFRTQNSSSINRPFAYCQAQLIVFIKRFLSVSLTGLFRL